MFEKSFLQIQECPGILATRCVYCRNDSSNLL